VEGPKVKNRFCRTILGILAVVTVSAGQACADTFEFLTYKPPAGWAKQTLTDGLAYRRASGIGLITFYPSSPATGSASDEFTKMWRARVEPAIPGAAPQPNVEPEGDYMLAIGERQVEAQGKMTSAALVTIVGKGRAIGVLTMASGEEALREVAAFLESVSLPPRTPGTTPQAGGIEVDFDVPPGYVSQREGGRVVLTPKTMDHKTSCVYGLSPARPSKGSLEADARAAILEAAPGWEVKNDHYNAMRGTSAAGWPYYWFRTDLKKLVGASYEYVTAMAMAIPGSASRVNIVWGIGNPARCTLDDLTFARLFHSLRPRGWTSDGGKKLSKELQGMWRNSQRLGMAQYKFLTNGRYEFGMGSVTRTGLFERTSSSVSDGRYELRGGELIITPDRRDRGPSKYRVRVYDEFVLGKWTRAMSLLDENAKPALEVQYMRVEDSR
jgi:hypothetical protein